MFCTEEGSRVCAVLRALFTSAACRCHQGGGGWGEWGAGQANLAGPEQGSLVVRGIKVRRNKRMFDDMREGTDAAAADGGRDERRRGGEEERWLLEVKYA